MSLEPSAGRIASQRMLLGALIFFLAAAPANPETAKHALPALKDAREYVQRADAYLQIYECSRANSDCDAAIELAPELAVAYWKRGQALYGLREYKAAIAACTQAISLEPQAAWPYLIRARAYAMLEQWRPADSDLSNAIARDPDFEEAYEYRCWLRWYTGQPAKAVLDGDNAIRLNPTSREAYIWRGRALSDLGKYKAAASDLMKAYRLGPEDHLLAHTYNEICQKMGKNPQDTEPSDAEAALPAYVPGQFQRSMIEKCGVVLRLNPIDPMAYHKRGSAYHDLREFTKAASDFNKAVELVPDNVEYLTSLADVNNHLGQHQEALNYATKAIVRDPKASAAYRARSIAHQLLGQLEKAEDDFQRVGDFRDPFFWVPGCTEQIRFH